MKDIFWRKYELYNENQTQFDLLSVSNTCSFIDT